MALDECGDFSPSKMDSSSTTRSTRARLREVALLFTRLGFTAFGGPAAHVAMIEDEVVSRRRWIDRQHFLDLVASVNFVPGPNSTELAIHLGLIRAGFAGLVVAGICFITPAVLIILPLAFFYVRNGALPQVQEAMSGINAAVVAIIAVAAIRFGQAAITSAFTTAVAALALVASFASVNFPQFQPELLILLGAAIAGAIQRGRVTGGGSLLAAATMPLASPGELWGELARMGLFFLKVGATLFGSGYVLVSYLQSGLVDQFQWLTRRELLDAISIGQVTPGPLLTTATFVGYVLGADKFGGGVTGGVVGGIVATVAIFLPSFFFIALLGRLLPAIRANRFARGALDAMNAAVVALIVVVCWRLGAAALVPRGAPDWVAVAIAIASLAAILRWKINATWLIIAGGLIGAMRGLAA